MHNAKYSWARVIAFYTSPQDSAAIGSAAFAQRPAPQAEQIGLTPFTSHQKLVITAHSQYPQILEGKQVCLSPLKHQQVLVETVNASGHKLKFRNFSLL